MVFRVLIAFIFPAVMFEIAQFLIHENHITIITQAVIDPITLTIAPNKLRYRVFNRPVSAKLIVPLNV